MKRNSLPSALCAGALAFLLGLGGTLCMITGLNLPAELLPLAIGCAVGAAIPAICLCIRKGELILCGIAAVFTALIAFSDRFQEQLLALCFSVLNFYHKGYGFPIPPQIDGCTADSQLLPLLFIAGIIMVATVWTVMRKTPAFATVFLSVLPLAACLVVTDTVPELLPIFLLLLGLVLLLMTQPIRRQNEAQGNRLTAMLAFPVIFALGGVFLMMPREHYSAPVQLSSWEDLLEWVSDRMPVLDQTSDGRLVFSFAREPKQKVDLSREGNRFLTSAPVMEVTTDHSGTLYLRGRDYDVYTGLGWEASEGRTETDYGPTFVIWQAPSRQAKVHLLGRHGQFYLPCYPTQPKTLTDGMIPNPNHISDYSYTFSPLRSDWKAVWAEYVSQGTMPHTNTPDELYLHLPDETMDRASEILNRVDYSGVNNTIDAAEAIARYVRQSADYDLGTDRMPRDETDFAIWFLEDSDSGYCVHFATATTVLLRAAGIPARYVEGYTVNTSAGQTTTVREKEAHAWVEYYLEYVGWVILDPTPGSSGAFVDPTEPTHPTEPEPPTTGPSVTEPQPTDPTETTTPEESTSAPITMPPTSGSSGNSGGTDSTAPPQWFLNLLSTIFWIALAGLVITGQWYLRRWVNRKKLHQGSTNRQAIARYRYALRLSRLSRTPLPAALDTLAQKARFSQHTLTAAELKQFDRFLHSCTDTLRQRPWYLQMIYRFVFAAY